ncbi:molybdopterin-dependent oxidoreductase [Escherichia coli]
MNPVDYTVKSLKEGSIRFAAEQPENGKNHPRNLFIWRSNLLGSSGKGHEFMSSTCWGRSTVSRERFGATGRREAGRSGLAGQWSGRQAGSVVTLDFRLSSTCLYSDIILPMATWYEKDDMNTSDMHPFIHPLSAVVDPAGSEKRLGNLQSHREEILRSVRRPSG